MHPVVVRLGTAVILTLCLLGLASARAQAREPIVIDGTAIYPESIGSSSQGALYVGSLGGTLYRASPGGGAQRAKPWIVRDPSNSLLSIFGVLADDRSHTLYVCSSPAALPGGIAQGRAAVMLFDLASGRLRASASLPGEHAICDDIAVAADGTAYVADIVNGEILSLAPHTGSLQPFAADPALKGIDGLAFAADGTLYADNVRTNQLLRIERSAAGAFTGVTPLEPSAPLAGPDGFRLIAGNRFVLAEARAGRIDEVTITGQWASIRVLASGLDSPSAATVVGDTVYAVEGKIEYLVDPKRKGQDPGPFTIRPIPIREARAPY